MSRAKRAFQTWPRRSSRSSKVEAYHERRYRKLLDNVNGFTVFKKDGTVFWKCRNCGYVYEGAEAPAECPACHHPQAYYELWVENY